MHDATNNTPLIAIHFFCVVANAKAKLIYDNNGIIVNNKILLMYGCIKYVEAIRFLSVPKLNPSGAWIKRKTGI